MTESAAHIRGALDALQARTDEPPAEASEGSTRSEERIEESSRRAVAPDIVSVLCHLKGVPARAPVVSPNYTKTILGYVLKQLSCAGRTPNE